MNKSYRLVWSAVRGAWMVVSELAKAHTKSGVAIVVVAATAAMPVHGAGSINATGGSTIDVLSDTYTGNPTIVSNGSTIQFAQGGIFNINSTTSAALSAVNNGTVVELGTGGGTYTINTGVGSYYSIEARSGGKIDLSKAASVGLTTQHSIGVLADQANSKIDISKLTLNQTGTGSTGYGIQAYDKGQITIADLNLTTNQTGVYAGFGNAKVTIGNAATKSTINSSGVGVRATNSGVVSLTNLGITTTAASSKGVLIDTGGTGTLTDVSITTGGIGAYGIEVDGTSTVNFAGTNNISTTGGSSSAVYLRPSAKTTGVLKGTLSTTGDNSVVINSNAVSLDVADANITATGLNSAGILLRSGTNTITGGSITIGVLGVNSNANGVYADNGASLAMTGTVIKTLGDNSSGMRLLSGATASLTDITVETSGVYSTGLSVEKDGTANFSGTNNISTLGDNAKALSVDEGGIVNGTLTGKISTEGNNSNAIQQSSTANLAIVNSTICTTGDNSLGLKLTSGSTTTLTNSTVCTDGLGSTGVSVDGTSTLNLAGTNDISTLGDNSDALSVNQGGIVNGTLTGKISTEGNNSDAIQSSAANLVIADATISTKGSDSLGLNLINGSTTTLNNSTVSTDGANSTGVFVAANSTLNLAGTNDISTSGQGSYGLHISAGATTTGVLTGTVSTLGDDAYGIRLDEANLAVANTTVTTSGKNAPGIVVSKGNADLTDITVITSGEWSAGIFLDSGSATLNGTNSITTTADNAVGVKVTAPSTVDFAGTTNINTAGTNSDAVLIEAGATVSGTLTGKISTEGNNADAIQSSAANLVIADATISTTGDGSLGLNLINGSTTTLTNSTVSTEGLGSTGVFVDGTSTLNLAGTNNISTLGDNSDALSVDQGGIVNGTLTGKISTEGNNSDAIQSSAANLAIADATISTTGDGSLGLNLTNGSTTTLTNSTVSTDGVGSTGALVDGTSTLTVNDASITTLGADSLGLDLNAGSTANLTDATIATSGANSTGVSVDGTSTLNLAGTQNISTLGDNSDALSVDQGGIVNGTLTGKISTEGNNSDAIQSSAANLAIADATISTTGDGSLGLKLTNGSTTTLTNSTVSTDGVGSTGALVDGTSTLTVNDASITTLGADSLGLDLNAGSTANLTDATIATSGANSTGVSVDGTSTLNLAGTQNISTLGDNSDALSVDQGGIVNGTLTGKISTEGNNSDAIQSSAANLAIADATISTTGDGSLGLNLTNGSTTTLTNSTVSTDGVGSTGALVDGTSTLTVNNSGITTLGADSLGLDLNAGSTANLTDATIATSGANSTGVSVDGTSTLNLAGTQNISTTGSDAIGILVEKDGTLTGTLTGSVSATGANSDAIVFVDTSNNTPSFALDNATVTSNNNALLLQAGSLNVIANDSNLTGDITAETGATLDFTMTGSSPANSVLTGAIVNANNTNLVSSTWNVTDDSQIQNLTNDSSIINFVNKDGSTPGLGYDDFKTLTVKEYTGVNSSDIYMNASLGGDNPAGTSSDKIVVEAGGSMSGPVTLHVNNVGGSGAPTYDGLKLIEAQSGATIDKSEMSIDGGYIPGGAYGYVVRQGQYSEPGDDQSLFLTNFAPKGTTIDENGFLVGAEGVIPPKPTTVAPGTGTGAGGAFAEGPSNTPSGNGHISSNGLTAYDNGSTNPDGSLPLTDANGNQIVYKKVTDEYGNTQLVPTGEVIKPVVPPVVDPIVPPVDPVVPPVVNPVAPIVKEGAAYIRTDVDANGNLIFTAYQEVTDANGNITRRVISLPNTGVTGQFNPSDADRGQTADKDGNLICNNGSRASDCALPTKDANGKPIVYAVDIDSNGNVFLRALVGDAATAAQKTYDFAAQMGGSDAPTVLYSPDFVTYNAIADVVSLSANTLLGTYHERMGTQNTAQIQAEKSSSYNANSWGRLIADNREVAYENAAFNQSIKGTTTGFQLGHSLWQSRNANNALAQAGLAIGYVKGSMDVFGDALLSKQIKTGTIDADTTSLMAYYTLATDKGTYLDAVVQYSYSNATAAGPQSSVALESTGLRGSLEVGVPVRFDALTLEPQAQLIAYKDKFDDAFDSNGYLMSQGDNSGVIVRLGARLTPSDTSSNFKPWFAANVNKQNASTATGVIDKSSNAGLNSEKDSAWADMSVGMSYQVNDSMSVYGHLKQSLAIDSGTNTVTSGAVGVQKSW